MIESTVKIELTRREAATLVGMARQQREHVEVMQAGQPLGYGHDRMLRAVHEDADALLAKSLRALGTLEVMAGDEPAAVAADEV